MRKLAITLSAVALLVSATTFGAGKNETTISSKAKATFENEFVAAENASWTKKGDVYFVTFDVNSKQNEAAFNEQGDLIAVSRVISQSELPAAVSAAIEQQFHGYETAKIATEINYENQASYYINVASSNEILKLKCAEDGTITIDSKTKR